MFSFKNILIKSDIQMKQQSWNNKMISNNNEILCNWFVIHCPSFEIVEAENYKNVGI